MPGKKANKIVSAIFGTEGLINSDDLVDFELGYLSLLNSLLDIAPNLIKTTLKITLYHALGIMLLNTEHLHLGYHYTGQIITASH